METMITMAAEKDGEMIYMPFETQIT